MPGSVVGSDDRITGRLRLALTVICVAQLMMVLDSTIVTVALPSIQRAMRLSPTDLVWVQTAYLLTYGGLLLLGGRAGDLFGQRRVFVLGLGLFTIASLFGGLATSSTWLVVTRAVQGVGGALASPTALSLIPTNFAEGPQRNKAMGAYSGMSAAGGAVGMLAGGLLVELVDWRATFFVNVPIGLLALATAPRALREAGRSRGRLDLQGAAAVTASIILMVYGLTSATNDGWGAFGTVVPLVASAVLMGVFLVLEVRTAQPLVPLRMFADRIRGGAYLVSFLLGAAAFTSFFFVTLFFQDVEGYSALRTGLSFLPIAAIVAVASTVSSRMASRVEARLIIGGGILLVAVGLGWLSTIGPASSYLEVLGPLLVLWCGSGFALVPLTLAALDRVGPRDVGLASALFNASEQVGASVGLAALATIAAMATRGYLHSRGYAPHGNVSHQVMHAAVAYGYTRALLTASAVAFGALVVVIAVIGWRNRTVFRAEAAAVADWSGTPDDATGV